MSYDVPEYTVETLVDGMIALLKKNLIAHSPLIADAHIGDTVIYVEDTLRFEKFQNIILMDNNSTMDPNTFSFTGVEFRTIWDDIGNVNQLVLKDPLTRDFLVSDNGRVQKTLKDTVLFEQDVLFGDRQVIAFDHLAICVEPENVSSEWLALQGLLGNDYKMSIIVYVKSGGVGGGEEAAQRICIAYADTIKKLLIGNIHVDLSLDTTPLMRDACPGTQYVYIGSNIAHLWPPDSCKRYEVQDNFKAAQELSLMHPPGESSSSSSTMSTCERWVLTSSSSTSSINSSSSSVSSTSSSSSSSLSSMNSSSSSSPSSQTVSSSSSTTSSNSFSSLAYITSSSSSSSSQGGLPYPVWLNWPLRHHFRVRDKAVLRRIKRFMYDSRVDNVEYGTVQKGSVFLKAARLSWFGKETELYNFPQVGKGSSH